MGADWRFTTPPQHGSWLNMAENGTERPCRPMPRPAYGRSGVLAVGSWIVGGLSGSERRRRCCWRFTTEDARIKLEKLYPVLEYPRSSYGHPLPPNFFFFYQKSIVTAVVYV